MMKINWFDCDLKVYDSLGMEVDITELPAKSRREIANAIINGNKCGSFSDSVVDNELLGELHPVFANELVGIAKTHQDAVAQREIEAQNRAMELKLIRQAMEVESFQQQKEEQEDE